MAEIGGDSAAPPQSRPVPPMITLPPPSSFETLFTGGPGPNFSPGPMTIVSNFFSDQYPDANFRSFFQLLAGDMASSAAQIPHASVLYDNSSSKEADSDKKFGGFKQNRPMDLVIAQSPSRFMFPSGFSPYGFLNSPGFFSPLQVELKVGMGVV